MRRIGVRELRQHASRWLRRVQEGQSLEITNRGQPVAMLVPIPEQDDTLARLVASGRVRPASGDLLDIEPLPAGSSPSLSESLEDMRADER